MSLKIDRVQLEIVIKNDQSRKRLRELEDQSRQLKKELKKLPEGTEAWTKKFNELKNVQRQMDGIIDKIGLTGLSLKELASRQKELNAIMRGMDPRTAEYKKLDVQLQQVKGRMAELRGGAEQTGLSLNKIANGFNKYAMIASAFAATTLGLVMGFRKIIDIANEFEKRVDNLSALTGLTGDKLKWLSEQAKDLSTSVIEGNIRITSSATEIVDAYTKVGSKRPELLKVKEDLNAVTKEAMILAAAANGELQPAVDGLTMVLNQFNAPASESRRIINVLAAGSKEGAGEIDYLTAGFEKSGSVAASFGISIEELTGVLETLAPRISEPEMAGRSLRNIMIKLETQSNDKLKPSIVGLGGAFEELHKQQWSVTQLTELFGTENINAANILMNNTAETKKYTAAVTGTSVALEQAGINTDNNASKLAQARNRYQLLAIELGEKLAPALTFSTNGFSYFMKAMMGGIKFFEEYGDVIKSITTGLLAYGVAIHAEIILTKLFAAAQWIATTAMKAFNLAAKSNPYTLLAGAIAFVIAKLILFDSSADKASKALTRLSDAIVDFEEKNKVGKLELIEQFRKGELTADEYQKAVDALNKKLQDYYNLNNDIVKGESVYTKLKNDSIDFSKWVTDKSDMTEVGNVVAFLQQNIANLDSQIADLNGSDSQYMKDILTETRSKQEADLKAIQNVIEFKKTIEEEQEEPTPGNIAGIIPEAWILEGQRNLYELERQLAKLQAIKAKAAEPIIKDEEDVSEPQNEYIDKLLKASYEGRKATIEDFHKDGKISTIEYNQLIYDLEVEQANKLIALEQNKNEAKRAFTEQFINTATQLLKSASDAQFNNDMRKLDEENNTAREKLQTKYDTGIISKDAYDVQMEKLQQARDKKDLALRQKQAKREKLMEGLSVGLDTVKAIAKINSIAAVYAASVVTAPLAAVAMAQIPWVLGQAALSLGLIAAKPIPQYADGNYADIIGALDGKNYRAKIGQNKTQLVNGPTFIPGLGLTGEGKKPKELVFSGDDTQRILNSPELIDAINYSIGRPQFASGNYPASVTNNYQKETFTDPALIKGLKDFTDVMARIERNGLSVPWNLIDEKNTKMKNLTESVRIK